MAKTCTSVETRITDGAVNLPKHANVSPFDMPAGSPAEGHLVCNYAR